MTPKASTTDISAPFYAPLALWEAWTAAAASATRTLVLAWAEVVSLQATAAKQMLAFGKNEALALAQDAQAAATSELQAIEGAAERLTYSAEEALPHALVPLPE